ARQFRPGPPPLAGPQECHHRASDAALRRLGGAAPDRQAPAGRAGLSEAIESDDPGELGGQRRRFERSLKRANSVGCRPSLRSCAPALRHAPGMPELERAKGFEPSTPTLARLCSTPELRPLSSRTPARILLAGGGEARA